MLAILLLLLASGELSNRRAPGFSLPDPDYNHFYDLQDYRGKVVLIDIMSTNCPHCLLLASTLETLKAKYGGKIQVISVVLPPDNAESVKKFAATNKITSPIVCDMGQMTISYFNAKPGQGHVDVPHLFLIDRQGMIKNDWDYSDKTRPVFEGPGLILELDKLLSR